MAVFGGFHPLSQGTKSAILPVLHPGVVRANQGFGPVAAIGRLANE
jgi:hypothetical protein